MHVRLFQTLAAVLSLGTSGCIVMGGGWGGPTVWAEATEILPIDPAGLESLVVRTHNGEITFAGQPEGASQPMVTAFKKGGGLTLGQAEEALAAIQVYVESGAAGVTKIGWRWTGAKWRHRRGQVSFEIKAPGRLDFDGETHNGGVEVVGVTGDVVIVTHNGDVNVDSANGKLRAETHNGALTIDYAGDDLKLTTHNGGIRADLGRCRSVGGSISTHNGGIKVGMSDTTSARLRCQTHNGRVSSKLPLNDAEISRSKVIGTIGQGGNDLTITTHNGGIQIKKSAG